MERVRFSGKRAARRANPNAVMTVRMMLRALR